MTDHQLKVVRGRPRVVHTVLTQYNFRRRLNCFSPLSVFIRGNTETVIDFECIPSYSQTLSAEIINMNNNVIIPKTSFKSGNIAIIATSICYTQFAIYMLHIIFSFIETVMIWIFNNPIKIPIIHWKNMKMVITTSWKIKRMPLQRLMRWKRTNKK